MAYGQDGPYRAYPAGADFSTPSGGVSPGIWRGVVLDSTGQVQLNTTLGGRIAGILQNDPKAAQNATYKVRDVTKAKAGGTFAIGANLSCMADGRFKAAAVGEHIVAVALTAGVANRIVSVEFGYMGVA